MDILDNCGVSKIEMIEIKVEIWHCWSENISCDIKCYFFVLLNGLNYNANPSRVKFSPNRCSDNPTAFITCLHLETV